MKFGINTFPALSDPGPLSLARWIIILIVIVSSDYQTLQEVPTIWEHFINELFVVVTF